MSHKERELFEAFVAGKLNRRELLAGAAKLGITAATAGMMLNMAQTSAMAADFDWMKYKGKKLKLLLNKHPYVDAMVADLNAFKTLTGMEVAYDVFPEDVYFDKVTAALSSSSSEYDAFMTGAYMTWTYGPAGWITDLNEYLKDPAKTNPKYAWDDVLPGLRASTAWNGVPGGELGSADAKQWCVPWGYELNNISYNTKMFEKAKVTPPKNMDEMVATAAKLTKDLGGPYGVGVRGSRSWATIHPGFLSAYSNFGQRDFTVSGGKLKAAMNTPVSKAFHKQWVEMIQQSGPKNWSTYTWYQVGTDLGAGASAMIFDADILGYFMNGGDNKEKGNIGYAPFAANPAATAPDAQCLDLVAGHVELFQAEGCRLVLHPMGVIGRARSVRRAKDGLRQPGPGLGLEGRDLPQADRYVLSGLSAPARRVGAGREDLLHAAAAVLRPDHAMGGDAAKDGGQGSAGR